MFRVDIKSERLFSDGNAEEFDLMKASSVTNNSASVILNKPLMTTIKSIRIIGNKISQSDVQ
jgi:hypothetical protein